MKKQRQLIYIFIDWRRKRRKKIANVTRILKETATDCFLNRKGLDFSETTITRIAPLHNDVEQSYHPIKNQLCIG